MRWAHAQGCGEEVRGRRAGDLCRWLASRERRAQDRTTPQKLVRFSPRRASLDCLPSPGDTLTTLLARLPPSLRSPARVAEDLRQSAAHPARPVDRVRSNSQTHNTALRPGWADCRTWSEDRHPHPPPLHPLPQAGVLQSDPTLLRPASTSPPGSRSSTLAYPIHPRQTTAGERTTTCQIRKRRLT